MSAPPQIIRVKRKRVDEAPVTFLQLDSGAKRHRGDGDWVYQRRDVPPIPESPVQGRPSIHVSSPARDSSKPQGVSAEAVASPASPTAARVKDSVLDSEVKRRRFHMSRTMLAAAANDALPAGDPRKQKAGPAVFVERHTKRIAKATRPSVRQQRSAEALAQRLKAAEANGTGPVDTTIGATGEKPLKKPGVRKRVPQSQTEEPAPRAPLPELSRHAEDMSHMAEHMNQWVLNEIGANLQDMQNRKTGAQQQQQPPTPRFKPKAPAQRFHERHPELAVPAQGPEPDKDTEMGDATDEDTDGEDWIIEEYVRVPVQSMALNVSPEDIGFLVLEGKEESTLFFGPEHDDEDDFDQDDEDENAENYYTADYPEDELSSDDEFSRQPYGYRHGNASDDEEFDNDYYAANDDEGYLMEQDLDDHDATLARIKRFMQPHNEAANR